MIRQRYEILKVHLNEKGRRLLLATEAKLIGWGGIATVNRETGVSCSTIADGINELKTGVLAKT